MPAQSQQQQKLFGLALSVKRGETPRSEASEDVLGIVDSMTEKEIEDFAGTSHKGLPQKVEEFVREEVRKHINENIPRMYKVYLGVQNKLRKLEDEQKKMLGQFKDEKDPKKKRNILDKMKAGTVRLKKVRANLADIEREYINKASYDTSYSENIKISKDDMDKLHSDGEVEVDGEKVTFEEGKKRFRQQDGIGKAKYTISYHDGKEKHKDGSDFFGIKIFKNKKDLETFRNALLKKGYIEESIEEASTPSIKMVNKFEPKEGIQIMAAKTIDGKTHFGGMVQRGKLARIIPFVPNQSKSDVQKRALQIFDELGKDESVVEGIEPQIKKIAYYTGTRPEAVEDFVSKHALNFTKLLKYVQKGGLPQRMEFVSALAGRPNNPKQKKIIKQFQESVNEEFKSKDSTFEKVYGIFDKKDYFNAKGLAKTQIGNFERALQRNDKGAQQILDKFNGDMGKSKEYIIQVISDQKKTQAYENYKALKMAVDSIQKGKPEQGAVGYVKRIIHNNNQKYSIALYSALRNQKFTKWKDIHDDVDSLIK